MNIIYYLNRFFRFFKQENYQKSCELKYELLRNDRVKITASNGIETIIRLAPNGVFGDK